MDEKGTFDANVSFKAVVIAPSDLLRECLGFARFFWVGVTDVLSLI